MYNILYLVHTELNYFPNEQKSKGKESWPAFTRWNKWNKLNARRSHFTQKQITGADVQCFYCCSSSIVCIVVHHYVKVEGSNDFILTYPELQISCVFVFFMLWKRVKTHVFSDQSVHITHAYCCVSKLSKFGAYLYSRVHNNTFLSLRNSP